MASRLSRPSPASFAAGCAIDVLTPDNGAYPVRSDSYRLFPSSPRRPLAPPANVEDLAGVLRRSDSVGFKAIFKAFYVNLVHYASVVVDSREDAEDVVQNVFTTLWCHRHTLDITSSSSLYLYSAVRYRAYDCLRQRATRTRAHTTAEQTGAPAASPDAELVVMPAFTGAPEQLWRIEQLPDGVWRITSKSKALAISAIGSSFATLAQFDAKSDKQRWLIKTP